MLDVYFNGNRISDYFNVMEGFDRGVSPDKTITAVKVGQMDGEYFQHATYNSKTITMPYMIKYNQYGNKYWRELGMCLNVDEPKPLIFGDEPDKYYLAMPTSAPLSEKWNDTTGSITWVCYEPYAISTNTDTYGWDESVTGSGFSTDLKGKIHGDLNSNSNMAFVAEAEAIVSRSPLEITHELDQHDYLMLYHKDGKSIQYKTTAPNNSARVMIRFNILDAIEKNNKGIWIKYGLLNNYQQVDWVKNNLESLTIGAYSWGHGSIIDANNGYRSATQVWDGKDWMGTQVNISNTPTLGQYTFTDTFNINNIIDNEGYVYLLTFSNVSDKNNPSIQNIDYAFMNGKLTLPASNTVTIDYKGTYPTPANFKITHKSDNGFIGLVSKNAIYQVGNTSEVDGKVVDKSQMLLDDTFDGTTLNPKWVKNGGFTRYSPHTAVHIGEYGMYTKPRSRTYVKSFGGGGHPGVWHGPSLYREIAADKDNVKGSRDFISDNYIVFNGNANDQLGVQEINITDENGKFVMGFMIRNYTWKNIRSEMSFWVGNKQVWVEESDRWNHFKGRVLMKKNGSVFTFELNKLEAGHNNTSKTFSYTDHNLESSLGYGITLWSSVWDKAHSVDMGVYGAQFRKMGMSDWEDTPNTFVGRDVLVLNSNNNKPETFLNNSLSLGFQDVGSQPILLSHGINIIQVAYSNWAERPELEVSVTPRFI